MCDYNRRLSGGRSKIHLTERIISWWVINLLSSGRGDMDALAWPDLARNVGVYSLGESGYPAIVNLYLRYDDDDDSKVLSPAARTPSPSPSLSRFSNNALSSSSSCRETRSNEREGRRKEEERLPIITLGGC